MPGNKRIRSGADTPEREGRLINNLVKGFYWPCHIFYHREREIAREKAVILWG